MHLKNSNFKDFEIKQRITINMIYSDEYISYIL